MNCPHCNKGVKFQWQYYGPIKKIDNKKAYFLFYDTCPNCDQNVIYYSLSNYNTDNGFHLIDSDELGNYDIINEILIYPSKKEFEHIDSIPRKYIEDYNEAREIISSSPKASAALSRRLLQLILREKYNIKEKNLSTEIQKFISLPGIPSHLTNAIDAIRNIGNFAAHPEKEENTGLIINVEPGEAEWLLEIIEALFDFAFIQPKKLEKRRNELNNKLQLLGKPKMK